MASFLRGICGLLGFDRSRSRSRSRSGASARLFIYIAEGCIGVWGGTIFCGIWGETMLVLCKLRIVEILKGKTSVGVKV